MATLVKANYRHAQHGGRQAAVHAVNYYAHRQDMHGDQAQRMGFSREVQGLDTQAMRDLVEQADGDYYYRIVLSPGASRDTAVDLQDWTRDLLLELETDHGEFPYVAVEHRDQTDYAHVHVVMVLEKKLDRDDLDALRETGTHLYELKREWYEPTLTQTQERDVQPSREFSEVLEGYVAGYQDEPDLEPQRRKRHRNISLEK